MAGGFNGSGNPRLWDDKGVQQACWADPIIKDAIWMAWHPDSQKLLAGRVQRVCTLDPQGSVHPFLESDKLGGDGSAAWSLDGKFVLISQTDGHILVADQWGKQVTRIATGGNGLPFTAWNRSTNQIAVAEAGQPLKFCDPTCSRIGTQCCCRKAKRPRSLRPANSSTASRKRLTNTSSTTSIAATAKLKHSPPPSSVNCCPSLEGNVKA